MGPNWEWWVGGILTQAATTWLIRVAVSCNKSDIEKVRSNGLII